MDLIKAILYDGDVFILDEPFNGIDDPAKEKIIRLLVEEAKTKLVLYVTHNEREIAKMGGVIIDLENIK